MSNADIILSISIPLIALFLIVAILFIFYKYFSITNRLWKGKRILEFDFFSRKFKLIDKNKNSALIFKHMKHKREIHLSDVIKQFVSKKAQKTIRTSINYIPEKEEYREFSFESALVGHSTKNIYKFNFLFSPMEDSSNFIVVMNWRESKKRKHVEEKKIEFTTKEQIVQSNFENKGFVAFNLSTEIHNAANDLGQLLISIYKKELIFYKNNDVLIVVFYGKTTSFVEKQINKFVDKIENKGKSRGIYSFFKGSGRHVFKNIDNNKKINTVMRVLDFFILLSIDLKKNFITNNNKHYSKENYQKFVKAQKMFRSSIRVGDIETEFIPVRNKLNNRKVISYANPKIMNMNKNMLSTILMNGNNKVDLINAQAREVGINSKVDQPTIMDVNSDWLIRNEKRLKYKKVIYNINVKVGTPNADLYKTINNLNEQGFYFAIRIIQFNESILTLIKQMKPQFVVIDKNIWTKEGILETNVYISLLSIKQIADQEKIKVIYESPSDLIDKKTAEKINLKFFYNV